jgi:hypothetical protein
MTYGTRGTFGARLLIREGGQGDRFVGDVSKPGLNINPHPTPSGGRMGVWKRGRASPAFAGDSLWLFYGDVFAQSFTSDFRLVI